MRKVSFQLSGALGTTPISDATSPTIRYSPTSLELLGDLLSASQGMWQWRPSSGGRPSRPCRCRPSGPVPLPLDLSSGRLATCALTRRYAALPWAPGFRPCPLLGFCAPPQWRTMPLTPHAFLLLLKATSQRSCMYKNGAPRLVKLGKAPSTTVAPETFGFSV